MVKGEDHSITCHVDTEECKLH